MQAFKIVEEFEKRVAEFAGAKHGIAVNTGTSAIFLSLQHKIAKDVYSSHVVLPVHTFISVPLAALQCGLNIVFEEYKWSGIYQIAPFDIWDGALRFRKNMYHGGLHCLSFQARKLLNIGEGGMILTDDYSAAEWLRAARYSGRKAPHYRVEDIDMVGWQMYMTPEKAARGLHLMEYIADDLPDQKMIYPDLRKVKLFHENRLPVGYEMGIAAERQSPQVGEYRH
jgi:dTDP-4-amino-4,6-dideoxygalactose transaminase